MTTSAITHNAAPRRSTRRSAAGRARAALERLHPDSVEDIARRVADLLTARQQLLGTPPSDNTPSGAVLIDAAELAQRTGLSRAYIYEHATDLGAIRIGDGNKPRLRFNWNDIQTRLGETRRPARSERAPSPAPPRRRPRRAATPANDALLPIKGQFRALMSRSMAARRRSR